MTWGAQIRSYTLQPYQLIKDVRTGHEVSSGGVQAVLDGELDGYVASSPFFLFFPPPKCGDLTFHHGRFLDASLKHFRASS